MNHGGSGSSLKSFSNAVIVTTVFEFMFYIRSLFIWFAYDCVYTHVIFVAGFNAGKIVVNVETIVEYIF